MFCSPISFQTKDYEVHGCYKRHTCSFLGVFIWIIVICAYNWMSSVFGKYLTMSLKVRLHVYVKAVLIINIYLNLISITSAFYSISFSDCVRKQNG